MNAEIMGPITASFHLGVGITEVVNEIPCGTSPQGDLVDCLIRVAQGPDVL